jgi:serine/threonine-protein kinase
LVTQKALHDTFELVGKTLDGQYRVEQIVGEGGFGIVYRGKHLSLEQPIAIKALKVLDADDPEVQHALLQKFKDEAKLLYTLSQASLNIVRSIDFGSISAPNGLWAPYMVLEWLEGVSLADDLEQRRQRGMRGRTVEETIALLASAAEGLSIAHEKRVAHRDVKPANFFLMRDSKGQHLKVLDFGIAKVLRDDDNKGGTKSKFASFTWGYAAPEQLDPRVGQQGLATDVYAFALVVTELLTDKHPLDGRDPVALLKAAIDPTIRPTPRQRGASVPDWLETVCRRALAVDPKSRYPTMGEFWTALTLAQGRPSANPVVTPNPPTRSPSAAAPPPTPHQPQAMPLHTPPPAQRMTPPPMSPQMYGLPPTYQGPAPMVPYQQPPQMQPQQQWSRGRPMVPAKSDGTIILFVVLMIVSAIFVGTCALAHSACG